MKVKYTNITLITINGKEIYLEFPEDIFEEVWKEIRIAFETQSLWNCDNWCNLSATLGDKIFTEIDFQKIIGVNM